MKLNLGTIAGSAGVPFGNAIGSIIGNILKGQDPDTHWEGWEALDKKIGAPLGTNAQNWVINNGDNPKSEALNILRWIQKYGINTVVNYSNWFKRNITMNDIVKKFESVGMYNEANQLKASQTTLFGAPLSSFLNFGNSANSQNSGSSFIGNLATQNSPMTKYLLIGVVAVVGFFGLKKLKIFK